MASRFDQAQSFIARHAIRMIDFKFSDPWGRWHHVSIPARRFGEGLVREGIGFGGPVRENG